MNPILHSDVLREPRPGDRTMIARYAREATRGHREPEWYGMFADRACSGTLVAEDFPVYSRRLQRDDALRSSPYLRMLDLGEPEPSGMIYSVQLLPWMISETRQPLPVVKQLADRLVEVNLLAVHKRHRRHGYAKAMLAETEEHYRAAGFAALLVIVDYADAPWLRGWYERRGFTFADPGHYPLIQFRASQPGSAYYASLNAGQIAGLKPLNHTVTVRPITAPEVVPGQKRPLLPGVLYITGLLD